jgi:hypothetical protein
MNCPVKISNKYKYFSNLGSRWQQSAKPTTLSTPKRRREEVKPASKSSVASARLHRASRAVETCRVEVDHASSQVASLNFVSNPRSIQPGRKVSFKLSVVKICIDFVLCFVLTFIFILFTLRQLTLRRQTCKRGPAKRLRR